MKDRSEVIGFTCSTFDLLHAGHIDMLYQCKQQCDYLIVGLQTDPTIDRPEKNKPVQTLVERWIQLNAVKYVDRIVPYQTEEDLRDILRIFDIDVRILGVEYEGKEFTGKDICLRRDIRIHYNDREHSFSSSGLRDRIVKFNS